MQNKIRQFIYEHALIIVTLAAVLLAAGVSVVHPLLTTDTACRYAPMAEAFAAGNWSESFHPRFDVAMPVTAGIVRYIFGVDGYRACAIVASIAWGLSIVPLFCLSKRLFDEHVAWFAVVLYIICPQTFIWAIMGLREPFKTLGVLLAMDALLRCKNGGLRNLAEAILGAAMLILFKVDSISYAILLVVIYIIIDKLKIRSLILALAVAILLQPCCWLVFDWTGVWLPAPQYVPIYQTIVGALL